MKTALSPDEALSLLRGKLEEQRRHLESWRRPSEALVFEVVRALDLIHCRELLAPSEAKDPGLRLKEFLSGWGANNALSLTMPAALGGGPFRLFESRESYQVRADELLTQCGALTLAELLEGLIEEGSVEAASKTVEPIGPSGIRQVLVLRSPGANLLYDHVAREHRRWYSDLTVELDAGWESNLAAEYKSLLPELRENVRGFQGWGISYSTNERIDEFFTQCAQVYLRRMWSQDLIGLDERFGEFEFRDFLGVLVGVAGRAQKHLCYASILAERHPELDLRNLLTTFAPRSGFIDGLAQHLDAEASQIEKLLKTLTLCPENCALHTVSADVAWAPIIQASSENYILPLYGLEINPFLFLLKDLQARYPREWDIAANNRERRWLSDISALFPRPRWEVTNRGQALKVDGRVVTDVDFIAFDSHKNEVGLFQLKWQVPVGVDTRARRSAGRNFVTEANKWISAVSRWLSEHGTAELGRRAGLPLRGDTRVNLFVIGRYRSSFSGYDRERLGATWTDWTRIVRARSEDPAGSICALAAGLDASQSPNSPNESITIPLGDLAILLNPRAVAKTSEKA